MLPVCIYFRSCRRVFVYYIFLLSALLDSLGFSCFVISITKKIDFLELDFVAEMFLFSPSVRSNGIR